MHLRPLTLIVSAMIAFAAPTGSGRAAPNSLTVSGNSLESLKTHLDPMTLARVIHDAETALKVKPHSVMEKKQTPPSGDKHDWYSPAPYWWPDPKNPSGPYIRRDGVRNPETNDYADERNFHQITNAAEALGIAYYLTGQKQYAAHAVMLLRTWFITPETKMNPNLNFSQFVRGMNEGRPEGIISTRTMPNVIDTLALIGGAGDWTKADDAAMRHWFGDYYNWLKTSDLGRAEAAKANNHGSWYDVQLAAIAIYLGQFDDARKTLNDVKSRIKEQINDAGLQPLELARTKSFSYSAMNLHALMLLASMARPLGIDLVHDGDGNGSRLLKAADALLPYDKAHPWPYEQIEKGKEGELCPGLFYSLGLTHEKKYADAVAAFGCDPSAKYQAVMLGQ